MQGNNFACFITGEKNKNLLTCHHLNSWDSYPDQRYDISNGITITKEIHHAFHKEYGAGKNTREQFERFLQEKYYIFDYPWQKDNHEPSLSIEKIEARRASMHDKYKEDVLSLTQKRGHILISAEDGFYNRCVIEIYCSHHNTLNQTTVKRYKHSRTGLRCCGRQAQSDKGSWAIVNDARRRAREAGEDENELSCFFLFLQFFQQRQVQRLDFTLLFFLSFLNFFIYFLAIENFCGQRRNFFFYF